MKKTFILSVCIFYSFLLCACSITGSANSSLSSCNTHSNFESSVAEEISSLSSNSTASKSTERENKKTFVYYDSIYEMDFPKISISDNGYALDLNGHSWVGMPYFSKVFGEGPVISNDECLFIPLYWVDEKEQPQEENFHWECFFYDGSSYMLPPRSNEKLFIRVEGTKLMVDENTWFDANTLEWVEDGEVVTTESGQIWGQVD